MLHMMLHRHFTTRQVKDHKASVRVVTRQCPLISALVTHTDECRYDYNKVIGWTMVGSVICGWFCLMKPDKHYLITLLIVFSISNDATLGSPWIFNRDGEMAGGQVLRFLETRSMTCYPD
jgi:hypothetical protein